MPSVAQAITKYSVEKSVFEKSKTQAEIKRNFTNDFVNNNRGREPTRTESMRVPQQRHRSSSNNKGTLAVTKSLSIDKRNTDIFKTKQNVRKWKNK